MAATNSMNMNQDGVQSYATSTGVLLGSPTTQFNVLVGDVSNKLTNVAPSATSGVPLVSQGAAANPAFGTAVVAGGGTGDTSFTPYTVICGGTTSTNPLQNVVSVGSSGQVLTSNGAGTLPTFQAVSSGGFNPSTTLQLSDDFIGVLLDPNTNFTLSSVMGWFMSSTNNLASAAGEAGHPGCIATINTTGISFLFGEAAQVPGGSVAANSIVLGGGTITLNWVFKIVNLSTASPRYILTFGLGDTISHNQANGCYVLYSDNVNSGNWEFVTANASSRTTSTSSVAATTGWHNAQITINAAASSVSFSMDGVSLGTAISTNIPTAAISPLFICNCTAGAIAAGTIKIDAFYITQSFTTPR